MCLFLDPSGLFVEKVAAKMETKVLAAPLGSKERPMYFDYGPIEHSLAQAVLKAREIQSKLWVKVNGDPDATYEVYPGGRNVRWKDSTLAIAAARHIVKPEGLHINPLT